MSKPVADWPHPNSGATKNTILKHPTNGSLSFGLVPRIVFRGLAFEEGQIRLTVGRHIGPKRGFGAEHIWAEH